MRRIYLAVALFCLYCLFCVGHFCTLLPKPEDKRYTGCFDWFSQCKTDPEFPTRGVIGYLDGYPADKVPAIPMEYWYLGRYALAPVCLEHSADHEWVLVNSANTAVNMHDYPNLRLVHDYGAGLQLYRRKN